MFEKNRRNENEKFSLPKIAQEVMYTEREEKINTSCCIDTTKIASSPCGGDVKTSCCIDTTGTVTGPCGSDIQTSCCVDTTKE